MKLIVISFENIKYFLCVFLMINFCIAILMKVLGLEIENGDDAGGDFGHDAEYPEIHNLFRIFLVSFRTSIGDFQMPFHKYWILILEKDASLGEFMIALIYIVWFVSIIFNNIILLNFLISYIC